MVSRELLLGDHGMPRSRRSDKESDLVERSLWTVFPPETSESVELQESESVLPRSVVARPQVSMPVHPALSSRNGLMTDRQESFSGIQVRPLPLPESDPVPTFPTRLLVRFLCGTRRTVAQESKDPLPETESADGYPAMPCYSPLRGMHRRVESKPTNNKRRGLFCGPSKTFSSAIEP